MSSWCDPWHTLTIVVKHFHGIDNCPGHDESNLWGVWTEPDIVEKDLVHPDSCKAVRAHDFDYRCATEQDVMDYYSEIDGPMESGTYRVRSSGSGPDYEGDYDADTEWEPVTAESEGEQHDLSA